jgi:prepilin-type N-terminal cleavage/methylation domain-containing protein
MLRSMKKEKGFTLVEVIIALAILGIIGIAFLGALATASKAVVIADERASSESLARTEMEYVKSQDYSFADWSYELPSGTSPTGQFPDWWDFDDPHTLPDGYTGFIVTVNAVLLHDTDDGIQKIIVTITYLDDDAIIELEGYKTAR